MLLLIASIIVYLFNNYYSKIYKFIGLLEWLKNVKKHGHTEIFLMAFTGYLEPKVSFKWFKNVKKTWSHRYIINGDLEAI